MDSFKIVLIILAIFLVYCYLKNNGYFKEDITIFEAVSDTIKKAILDISLIDNKKTHLSTKAFEIALNKLL